MKRVIGLLVLQLICLSSFANTFIYGIVTGIEGKPLIGANVVIEGSYAGTATNSDGRFRLNVRDGQYGLRVSHMGYETVFMWSSYAGETRLDISLDRLAYLAEEVIVSATRAHSKVPVAYTDVSRPEIESRDLAGYTLSYQSDSIICCIIRCRYRNRLYQFQDTGFGYEPDQCYNKRYSTE
jgi:iron complex outermembrane recepter protein